MSLVYLHLAANSEPPVMADTVGPYRAIIVVEQDVDPAWRDRISAWLVETGCLFMLAWGNACGDWDDSVDWASLEASGFRDGPENQFVMTTWHDQETLPEVFWFARHCGRHGSVDLPTTLILHIAPKPREMELIALWDIDESDLPDR